MWMYSCVVSADRSEMSSFHAMVVAARLATRWPVSMGMVGRRVWALGSQFR